VTWLTWRQQRTETLIAAAPLALVAAVLVPTGLHIASVYDHDHIAACLTAQTGSCRNEIQSFMSRFELGGLVGWFNLVPGLVGILLATPFVLELEHGTYRLAWTQSISRDRWLTIKLGLIGLGALASSLLLTLLLTWWREPLDHLNGRMGSAFDFEGTVPYAYTFFAVGLVLAIGVVMRRAAAAIGIALIAYLIARLATQTWLRPHYAKPLTRTWPATQNGPDLRRAWVLTQEPSDRFGHGLNLLPRLAGGCNKGLSVPRQACLQRADFFQHAVYQPAGRFWLFQAIETAIFGGTALALAGFAIWWVRKRAS
jgi:hypothetical protein